jgi:hypothetical protein
MPGLASAGTHRMLARAGSVHARLLAMASGDDPALASLLSDPLRAYLKTRAATAEKCRWLDAPQFIEALHALSQACPQLIEWDHGLTACTASSAALALARAKFGNVALPLQLMSDRAWCGRIQLASNAYGRIAFPGSSWSIVLRTIRDGRVDLLTDAIVCLDLDRDEARFEVEAEGDSSAIILTRDDCLRLLFGGDLNVRRIRFPHATIRPQLIQASLLGRSGIRLETIRVDDARRDSPADSIVATLFEAIARNSPAIYTELGAFIHTVRVFELPQGDLGLVQSFSAPTEPGVIGFNIAFSPDGDPYLSPLCFTWLGHELAHTKHYLADDIAFGQHARFVENPGEWTAPIACYGRALRVGTLFQIPYVHLYERALLMDFAERGFAGLPWEVDGQWRAAGEEMAGEIAASFDLMDKHAHLTPLGNVAVEHLHKLESADANRWRQVCDRAAR